MPRRKRATYLWAMPFYCLCSNESRGQIPNQGHSPEGNLNVHGRAKPILTTGGKAEPVFLYAHLAKADDNDL